MSCKYLELDRIFILVALLLFSLGSSRYIEFAYETQASCDISQLVYLLDVLKLYDRMQLVLLDIVYVALRYHNEVLVDVAEGARVNDLDYPSLLL